MAEKSVVVQRLDTLQARLATVLKPLGFRRKGRFFNRETEPGLVQVIGLQAGQYEIGPPLPPPVQHWRPNLYGQFTVNLGVYVEEVHARDHPAKRLARVADYHCAIRVRLSVLTEDRDQWWPLEAEVGETADDLAAMLLAVGVPFLDRFHRRDAIVSDWIAYNEAERRLSNVARLDVAMILLARGDATTATQLFEDQIASSALPRHQDYVREKGASLGLFG